MKARLDFLAEYQTNTKRNYVQRVVEHDKAASAAVAKQWGQDYWDGERRYGYGGYRYDGRWLPIAHDLARHYGLKAGDRVLDVGCGKGFLLHELTVAVPGLHVCGLDISSYAKEHAKPEVEPFIEIGNACQLPWPDVSFDLVLSLNTFHNLSIFDLKKAIQEVSRVARGDAWICVESYRTEREKANLLYWQLTCASFFDVAEWEWLYREWGYSGDYGFIFFE